MAKVNFKFQKRQKELDRQNKQMEKQLRKQKIKEDSATEAAEADSTPAE